MHDDNVEEEKGRDEKVLPIRSTITAHAAFTDDEVEEKEEKVTTNHTGTERAAFTCYCCRPPGELAKLIPTPPISRPTDEELHLI